MTIIGIGIDLCLVERIRFSYEKLGQAWADEIFTRAEQTCCRAGRDPPQSFAVAFSCKEACSKALGTGFGNGIMPKEIEVLALGALPLIRLRGASLRRAKRRAGNKTPIDIFATCTTGQGFVSSSVIITARNYASG
jgi:holo-[acyl-carrier protein] synthase